jgi:diguanylate cyclase (GGDEF)-like protein
MEFDISGMRNTGALTIAKILGINIIFLLIALVLINRYVSPYIALFSNMQEGIKKASAGDFTHKFFSSVGGDAYNVITQLNTLFEKMQETVGDIKYNLATFVPQGCFSSNDPLYEAKTVIKELSDIYKFKKTIELDENKTDVYNRIIDVLTYKYGVTSFVMYEVNSVTMERKVIYTSTNDNVCKINNSSDSMLCRAYRTHTDVVSSEFINLCKSCGMSSKNYICIPFTINKDASIVITITTKTEKELNNVNSMVDSIKNYLEAAKAVIESRLLMDKLRDTSLRDGMTGLYNRRFLEEFIDQVMSQVQREKETYSVMMLDVDFFKSVNDTYGHDVGDKVIVELAKLLKDSIRASDLAIRYGGEEFVILLHNADDAGALAVANKIHIGFSKLVFEVGAGETIQKTVSIGISKFPKDGDTIWKCIKFADTALYKAKTTGRNKIVSYLPEMSKEDVR